MARLGRCFLPDQPLRGQRGNNRQAIFFTGEDYAHDRAIPDAVGKRQIAKALGRRVAPLPKGRPRKAKTEKQQLKFILTPFTQVVPPA